MARTKMRNDFDIMWKTYKELREYHSFVRFCVWAGNWRKASWVCDNRIAPAAQRHPILNFLAFVI